MNRRALNVLLLMAFIMSIVMLFWPFAQWDDTMSIILRIIPSFSVQLLLIRVGKYNIIKLIPLILTGLFALWSVYLYLTSPDWSTVTFKILIAWNLSPFISCIAGMIISAIIKSTPSKK